MRKFIQYVVMFFLVFLVYGCNYEKNNQTQVYNGFVYKKLLIPLYIYPESNADWQPIVDIKKQYPTLEIVAIVNQENGKIIKSDPNFVRGLKQLRDANISTIGYVYTQYANRSIDEVKKNIDDWDLYYRDCGLDGIFFDESAYSQSVFNYYDELSNYVRDKGLHFIVLNPGRKVDEVYIQTQIATVIVTKETTYEKAIEATEFNAPSDNTKLGLLLYQSDVDDVVSSMCRYANTHNFDYIYFTDDGAGGSNPWDSFSSYLDVLANNMTQGCL